jgi:hypothetical protein
MTKKVTLLLATAFAAAFITPLSAEPDPDIVGKWCQVEGPVDSTTLHFRRSKSCDRDVLLVVKPNGDYALSDTTCKVHPKTYAKKGGATYTCVDHLGRVTKSGQRFLTYDNGAELTLDQ